MLRTDKAFPATLTKFSTRAQDEKILVDLNIRHTEEGDSPLFLKSYSQKVGGPQIAALFGHPIDWTAITIDGFKRKFKVEFDEIDFNANLVSIKSRQLLKNGSACFVFDLAFQKEVEAGDPILQSYLNQKELADDGKKRFILYSVYLTPSEDET